jgi:D-glutamate cyclase
MPEHETDTTAQADAMVAEFVGENLDQLSTLDMRGDGVLRVLYRAARRLRGEPQSLAAARLLLETVQPGNRVLMLTGFMSPKPFPETDGLVGSAVLAAALERACGAVPVFVCESEVMGALCAALRGAGLNLLPDLESTVEMRHPAVVLPFPYERQAAEAESARLATLIQPVICVAIERAGANPKDQYHYAMGKNVSTDIAPIDLLYRIVMDAGLPTVAVGDFGNELGMGAIIDTIRAETPAGGNCGCGCGAGTGCATPADVTVLASTSDWGAYAVSACLAYLKRDLEVLVSAQVYRRICDDAVRAGAVDGPTGYAVPWVDGIDDGFNAALLEVMRGVVRYPARPTTHSPIRLFHLARRLAGG